MRRATGTALLLVGMVLPRLAEAQTREFLDAPIVTSTVRVDYDAAAKKIKYALDGDPVPHDMPPDMLLLAKTKSGVIVTYRRMNPLRLQAAADITDVEDPAHGQVGKLLNAILAIAKVINPEAPTGGSDERGRAQLVQFAGTGCTALDQALPDALALDAALYSTATSAAAVKARVKAWIGAIDKGFVDTDGEGAIAAGVSGIEIFATTVTNSVAAAEPLIARIETESRKPTPGDRCQLLVHAFYSMLNLADPRERLQELNTLKAALNALATTLRDDFGNGHWIDGTDDFKVSGDILPTGKTAKKVVVKVNAVTLDIDNASSALAVAKTSAATASFLVRRHSNLAIETGVGVLTGFVQRPTYGTGTNAAGHTVVAATDNEVSVDPAVLLNFVCRCATGPFITPMFQVGASTSKSAPSIFFGGGFRLFGVGAGDIAFGGGFVLAFIQELDELEVGQEIDGTADIDADLVWAPRFRSTDVSGKKHTNWYLSLQYKF